MDQASSSFRCPTCSKNNFFTRTDYNRHLRKHDKAFACAICGRHFGLQSDVDRHRRSHQVGGNKYKCSYKCLVPGCKFQGAVRKDNLWRHMKEKHSSGPAKVSKKDLQTYYKKAESVRDPSEVRLEEKNLELLEAAALGDTKKVKEAIRGGADGSTADERGHIAVYIAINGGYTSLLNFVIHAGIKLNNVLYHAVEAGNVEVVKTISDAEVEIDIKYPNLMTRYRTPLGMCFYVRPSSYRAKTDDPRHTEFLFIFGQVDIVRILIAREHDINRRHGHFSATLLHLVAVNHAQLVTELIQRGFEINAKDVNQRTPLSYALAVPKTSLFWLSEKANEEAARLLLDAGAEISTEDLAFMTPNLRAEYIDR